MHEFLDDQLESIKGHVLGIRLRQSGKPVAACD